MKLEVLKEDLEESCEKIRKALKGSSLDILPTDVASETKRLWVEWLNIFETEKKQVDRDIEFEASLGQIIATDKDDMEN